MDPLNQRSLGRVVGWGANANSLTRATSSQSTLEFKVDGL